MNGATPVRLLPGLAMTDVTAKLSPWQATDPPERLIIVGAGRGTGPWVQAARRWAVPDVWLIEADVDACQSLQRLCTDWPGSQSVHAVVAEAEGDRPFHTASLMTESGLLDPEALSDLYPHLSSKAVTQRRTTTLDILLGDAPAALSWLVVDCTCASAVLDGARAVLDQFDLVVLRRYAAPAASVRQADDMSVWVQALDRIGFVLRGVVEGRHPGIDHTIYVRDHRRQLGVIRQALQQARQDAQRALSQQAVVERAHELALQAAEAGHQAAQAELQARFAAQAAQIVAEHQRADSAKAAAVRAELAAAHAFAADAARAFEEARGQHEQALQLTATLQTELHAAATETAEGRAVLAQQTQALAAAEHLAAELRQQLDRHKQAAQLQLAQHEELQAQALVQHEQATAVGVRAKELEIELGTTRQSHSDMERVQHELLTQLSSASVELNARPARLISQSGALTRPIDDVALPMFFSFWGGGPLSPFEWLCLKSFADFGHSVTLYSYDRDLSVPSNVELADAREILPENLIGRIRHDTGSIYAPFSDYFRYAGIRKTGRVWIDADMLCLSEKINFKQGYILCGEDARWVSSGVIGLPQDSPCLDALVERCEASIDVPGLPWGSFGPKLLTPMLQKDPNHQVLERFHFYPVHWRKTAQLFLPAEREGVRRDACGSWGIHLWNEVIIRSGYHKRLCPPVGSFIHDKIVEHGVLDRFVDVLPEETMVLHASRFR